jgi:hypothetical protein
MVGDLRLLDCLEFVFNHPPIRVQAIPEPCSYGLSLFMALPKVFAECASARLLHASAEFADILPNCAVFTAISLPVALKPATVSKREQHATEFMCRERPIQSLCTQSNGVEVPDSPSLLFAIGQQALFTQESYDNTAPAQHAITITARPSFASSFGSVRFTVLRIAPIGMDKNTAIDQLDGFAIIKTVKCPSDAVGAKVESETQHLPSRAKRVLSDKGQSA